MLTTYNLSFVKSVKKYCLITRALILYIDRVIKAYVPRVHSP